MISCDWLVHEINVAYSVCERPPISWMNNLMVLMGRLIHTQKRNQLSHLEITILLRKKKKLEMA